MAGRIQHHPTAGPGVDGVCRPVRHPNQGQASTRQLAARLASNEAIIDIIPHLRALASTEGLTSAQTYELARLWLCLGMRQRPWTRSEWDGFYQRLRGRL